MSGEVCWLRARGRLGFLRKRISRKEKEKEEGTKYIKGFFCLMRGTAKLVWDQCEKVPALQSFQELICYSVQNIKKGAGTGRPTIKLKVKPDHCMLGLGSGSLQAPEQKMAPSCF